MQNVKSNVRELISPKVARFIFPAKKTVHSYSQEICIDLFILTVTLKQSIFGLLIPKLIDFREKINTWV